MIEVILLERIERLGSLGSVVRVRPGFARNWLLPQHKALRATKANLARFAAERAQIEARNADLRTKAEAQAARLAGLKLVIIRQAGETGHLYGSITARDIVEAATAAGYELQRNHVVIDTPIKTTGLHNARLRLHAEVSLDIVVNVARSLEESRVQAEKGSAAVQADGKAKKSADAKDDEEILAASESDDAAE